MMMTRKIVINLQEYVGVIYTGCFSYNDDAVMFSICKSHDNTLYMEVSLEMLQRGKTYCIRRTLASLHYNEDEIIQGVSFENFVRIRKNNNIWKKMIIKLNDKIANDFMQLSFLFTMV